MQHSNTYPPLVLASASQRRLDLLRQIAIEPVAVFNADIDETIGAKEAPLAAVQRLALAKARQVAPLVRQDQALSGSFILGADTLVCLGRHILGKPQNGEEAEQFLKRLAGRSHKVHTGLCVIDSQGRHFTTAVSTRVRFRPLTTAHIRAYINHGEWCGKAGGYAIQGRGALLVERLVGSYSNVVGLPLAELGLLLERHGFYHG